MAIPPCTPAATAVDQGRAAATLAKVVANWVPSAVTEMTMTTAMRPAIKPYSSAVTPRSSVISARRLLRNVDIAVSFQLSRGASGAASRECA
jgi:hypothetical protein